MSSIVKDNLSPEEFAILLTFESDEDYSMSEVNERLAKLYPTSASNVVNKYFKLEINQSDTLTHIFRLIRKGYVKTLRHNQRPYLHLTPLGESVIDVGT